MSISSATQIAYSGLAAAQVQMTVASANISNADTPGYTEKTGNQSALVSAGAGSGVSVSSITSTIDKLLMKSLVGSTSDLGSANSINNYLDQLQELYGSTGDSNSAGTSLGNTLALLGSAISALAASPGDASLSAAAVQALSNVTSQLNGTSSGIQKLRGNADQDIASTVSDTNTNLQLIGSLNAQIVQATAAGQPTGDLEDQRNTALQAVAKNLNISYFTATNGSIQVYTASGQALVDGSSVHALSYTPASTVTSATIYSATPPSGFSGIMVNGIDITSQIQSGALGGLLSLRDSILPGAQTQLDQLAGQLVSSLNAAHNQGTALPPPSTLTGSATVSASTPLSATGVARFAVTDQKGNLVSYQDLDLSNYTTVGDLVSAINGISGLTASINANGNVVIAATTGTNGIAINEMSSAVGSGAQGLSDYLGLNDLVTGTGASNISVRSDIQKNSGLLATSTLDSSATLTAGSSVLSAGSETAANNIYSVLTSSTTFPAAGGLGSVDASFADYASDVVASVASKASQASSDYSNKQTTQSAFANTISSESGVNLDEETAKLSSLQNEYTAAAELLQVINQMFSALMGAVQTAVA